MPLIFECLVNFDLFRCVNHTSCVTTHFIRSIINKYQFIANPTIYVVILYYFPSVDGQKFVYYSVFESNLGWPIQFGLFQQWSKKNQIPTNSLPLIIYHFKTEVIYFVWVIVCIHCNNFMINTVGDDFFFFFFFFIQTNHKLAHTRTFKHAYVFTQNLKSK